MQKPKEKSFKNSREDLREAVLSSSSDKKKQEFLKLSSIYEVEATSQQFNGYFLICELVFLRRLYSFQDEKSDVKNKWEKSSWDRKLIVHKRRLTSMILIGLVSCWPKWQKMFVFLICDVSLSVM